jgi:hypothetical protein
MPGIDYQRHAGPDQQADDHERLGLEWQWGAHVHDPLSMLAAGP